MSNSKQILMIIGVCVGIALMYMYSNNQPNLEVQEMNYPKYEWYARESWDGRFPMYLHEGYYTLEDGGTKYIPNGFSAGDWGQGMSIHSGGNDVSALPIRLSVKYVSFAEKKCYAGDFELPIDTIKKYFSIGGIDESNGEYFGYENIITGITPGGTVVVWVKALFEQIEIARFQAEEIDLINVREVWPNSVISQEDFYNLEKEFPEQYPYIKEHGVPFGIWDKYRTRFNWELKWDLPEEYEVYQYKISMFNKENCYPILFFKEYTRNQLKNKDKAIPLFTVLEINKKGTKQIDHISMYYDFEEMYKIMSTTSNPNTLITIKFKLNEDFSTEWYVEIEGKKYPIKGSKPIKIMYGENSDEDSEWERYQEYLKNPNKAI